MCETHRAGRDGGLHQDQDMVHVGRRRSIDAWWPIISPPPVVVSPGVLDLIGLFYMANWCPMCTKKPPARF